MQNTSKTGQKLVEFHIDLRLWDRRRVLFSGSNSTEVENTKDEFKKVK